MPTPDTPLRHIAVLTGKRGGFGAMKPMLRLMADDPGIRLSLIVTDQHVDPRFGATIAEVTRDFEVAAAVAMDQADGSPAARAAALGTCLNRMSGVLAELAPDVLVLYGDRGEVLATALAAVHLRIPIAHLQGGDVSGNVDECMRHAVTKLAHLHFPATEDSGRRIIAMGEAAERVFVVGDNHIDQIVAGAYTAEAELRRRFDLPAGERPVIVLQHPETTRRRDGEADMRATLQAVVEQGRRAIVVYPCSDHGYEDVVRAIEGMRGHPLLDIHRNIDAPDFWGLLAIADCMVGNSSAGLIETPSFRLPAVNLGERQKGRQHAENLIHAEFGLDSVRAALATALDPAFRDRAATCSQPFGDGTAGRRIVEVLRRTEFGPGLLDKRMTY